MFLKILALLALTVAPLAQAYSNCEFRLDPRFNQSLGPNFYAVGIPSEIVESGCNPSFRGRQRQSKWCWAASTQMLLNLHGFPVSQEQIVKKIYGALVDQVGTAQQVAAAMEGWKADVKGRPRYISAKILSVDLRTMFDELSQGYPTVVMLKHPNNSAGGHALLLTGMEYRMYNGMPVVEKVHLRDPLPQRESHQVLSGQEFLSRVFDAVSLRIKNLPN